jgi:hypothetical protein
MHDDVDEPVENGIMENGTNGEGLLMVSWWWMMYFVASSLFSFSQNVQFIHSIACDPFDTFHKFLFPYIFRKLKHSKI